MSKWLKLLKQMETPQPEPAAVSSLTHQEDVHPSGTNNIFHTAILVLMLIAAFLTIKTGSSVQKSEKQSVKLTQQFELQQTKIQQLESELANLRNNDLAALQNKISNGNDELERLSLENTTLKVKVKELEFSEQQMIDEIMTLTQEDAKANQLIEGRKI